MPFDLVFAARTLRARHRDALGFRQALLDFLFAAGCSVREQAVALEHGDAVCVRTTGPAAPNGEPALVLVAVDLDAPAPVRSLGGEIPRWSESLATLGGPDIAIGWLAALRALVASTRQRPWEAIFVRGPALGTAGYLGALLEGLPPEAQIVQLAASLPPTGPGEAVNTAATCFDMARLELVRSRNIWRFPACDHAYA
ncbi:MAG: hypothetical protein EXR79_17135, partial [Myxococcales bacterium]|nr:hypothetical protein [Myxococcales bacterium]